MVAVATAVAVVVVVVAVVVVGVVGVVAVASVLVGLVCLGGEGACLGCVQPLGTAGLTCSPLEVADDAAPPRLPVGLALAWPSWSLLRLPCGRGEQA
eukprot:11072869-Alexandrium_andersonii.AAC.1